MHHHELTRRSLLTRALAGGGGLALAGALPALAEPRRLAPGGVVFDQRLADPPARARAHAAASGAWVVRPPVQAPARFDLLGVEWERPGHVHIELRVRPDGGAWSPWVPANAHSGHAPDGGRADRRITDPVWAGGADVFQLRSSEALHGVLMHFVNSTGTATAADRARTALAGALAGPAAARLAGPNLPAGPGQPPIVARSVWGRGRAIPRTTPAYGAVEFAVVHHTESANAYSPRQTPAMIRAIFYFHRDVNGWNDIGYNFVVDRYGQIYEARLGGISEAVIGAHAGGFNTYSTGIAALGSFQYGRDTARGTAAIERLLAWKLALHGVTPNGQVSVPAATDAPRFSRFRAGQLVSLRRISGHRDADQTVCPGAALYRQLPGIRGRVSRLTANRIAEVTIGGPVAPPAYPAPFPLFGVLQRLGGAPIAGVGVEVQQRTGTTEQTIATATTAADGSWNAAPVLAANAPVRALFRGAPGLPATVSPAVEALVATGVTLQASASQVPPGTPVQLSGTVQPAKAQVALVVSQQGVDGSFRRVQTIRAGVAPDGSYAATLTLTQPGQYAVAAQVAADAANVAGASPAVAITVA